MPCPHAHPVPCCLLSHLSVRLMLRKPQWPHWVQPGLGPCKATAEAANAQALGSDCHAPVKAYVHDMCSSTSALTSLVPSSTPAQEQASQRGRGEPPWPRNQQEVRQCAPAVAECI